MAVTAHYPTPRGIPSLDDVKRLGWHDRGDALERVLRFRDREQAVRAGEYVTLKAVDWLRRPYITVARNELHVVIANPNNAGVTPAELRLASKVSAVVDELRGV